MCKLFVSLVRAKMKESNLHNVGHLKRCKRDSPVEHRVLEGDQLGY